MNQTVRDILMVAGAIGIGYFLYKEWKSNQGGNNSRPNKNKITRSPVISDTHNNASESQLVTLTGGPSPDGSN